VTTDRLGDLSQLVTYETPRPNPWVGVDPLRCFCRLLSVRFHDRAVKVLPRWGVFGCAARLRGQAPGLTALLSEGVGERSQVKGGA